MARRNQRLCRICKKSPVWRGGDVKDPGQVCKKCYHKHVWAGRPAVRKERREAEQEQVPHGEEIG
jgi:hypothetical protein